jgi:acyl-coenzyme A thioesterase PaaI-like protein
MDITQLPFNRLIGIQCAESGSPYLLTLPDSPEYHNHLGTVHASAMLSLAEAASGEFLIQTLGATVGAFPVVRRLEARFKKPGMGKLLARCAPSQESASKLRADLESKGRGIIELPIEVCGTDGTLFLTADVEWFIAMQK